MENDRHSLVMATDLLLIEQAKVALEMAPTQMAELRAYLDRDMGDFESICQAHGGWDRICNTLRTKLWGLGSVLYPPIVDGDAAKEQLCKTFVTNLGVTALSGGRRVMIYLHGRHKMAEDDRLLEEMLIEDELTVELECIYSTMGQLVHHAAVNMKALLKEAHTDTLRNYT